MKVVKLIIAGMKGIYLLFSVALIINRDYALLQNLIWEIYVNVYKDIPTILGEYVGYCLESNCSLFLSQFLFAFLVYIFVFIIVLIANLKKILASNYIGNTNTTVVTGSIYDSQYVEIGFLPKLLTGTLLAKNKSKVIEKNGEEKPLKESFIRIGEQPVTWIGYLVDLVLVILGFYLFFPVEGEDFIDRAFIVVISYLLVAYSLMRLCELVLLFTVVAFRKSKNGYGD